MGISAENAELSQRGVQQAQQPAGSNDLPFSVVSRSWTSATWKVKVKVCMYVCMYVCMRARVHVRASMHACTHVCVYVYIYIYVYVCCLSVFVCVLACFCLSHTSRQTHIHR